MRIGLDAKRAFNNSSGLGNYSRFVITSLLQQFPENQYCLFTPRLTDQYRTFYPQTNTVAVKQPLGLAKAWPGWWRTRGLNSDLKKSNIQLYHGLSNELPLGINPKFKMVVTIHDLIFVRYPQLYNPLDRFIYDYKTKYACRRADKIIAISAQTKADLIKYYGIDSEKIKVIYQDCNSNFHELLPASYLNQIKEKYALPDQFILCVGTLEPRKNQLHLLRAWQQAGLATHLPIVFIGKATPYKHQLAKFAQQHQIPNQVLFLPYIPPLELPAIYQLAYLFVYPSVFEGFGIPIIEALNSGVPVITSTGSCFAEAGGEAALYAEPDNTEQLSHLLIRATQDQALRAQMKELGFKQAKTFRAEITIPQIQEVYEALLRF